MSPLTIAESRHAWVYPALVGASLVLLFVVPSSRAIAPAMRRKYAVLQGITLLGAIVGAKVAMLMGDLGWPVVPLESWRQVVYSGRSIMGGLLGGLACAEAAKPLLRYSLPPNDHFAAKLPFSIALGRVGCFFGGCCRGTPHDGWLSVAYEDGVARWPAQAFEGAFQLAAGALLVALVRRRVLSGRLFSLYLVLYGVFRFGTELVRETPKPLGAFSVYQALALIMTAVGAAMLAWRAREPAPAPIAMEAE